MGDKHKAAHHKGTHQAIARRVTQAAYHDPRTLCMYCHRTLDKCGPNGDGKHRNGTSCIWHACHVVDGDSSMGYLPGCSFCNQSEGIRSRNAKVEPHSERWT